MLAFNAVQVPDAAADKDADSIRVSRYLETAVPEGFVGSGGRELRERPKVLSLVYIDVLERIKVFDFACKPDGKLVRIELCDRTSAAFAGHQPCPRRLNRIS